ncbi:uncharacterized protein LOC134817306 [Bolinopsis microptera]|uniref:uncharacterized protein LOC134817306 n=1 Tax=Bolinopsis microptera TaxID=2820187 RepID=UPI00307A6FFD
MRHDEDPLMNVNLHINEECKKSSGGQNKKPHLHSAPVNYEMQKQRFRYKQSATGNGLNGRDFLSSGQQKVSQHNLSTDRRSSRGEITDFYQALEIGEEEATADELRESLNFFLKRPPVNRPHKIVVRNQPPEKTALDCQVNVHMNYMKVKTRSERNTQPPQASQVVYCENCKHGFCFVHRVRDLLKLSGSNNQRAHTCSSRGRIRDFYQALEIAEEEATADELREYPNSVLKRPPVKIPHKLCGR